MKILAVFIDMISGEKLNLCNERAERTVLDDFIENLGGTLYTNCYTPAPDTPRSSGCMWSGLYPKGNGCDLRYKYPQEYMNEDIENLWEVLRKLKYDIHIFMEDVTSALGVLPKWLDSCTYADDHNIEGFMNLVCEGGDNDSFSLIYLPDFHVCIDMFAALPEGVRKGEYLVRDILTKIFSKIDIEEFDNIILFSDHGFRVAGEKHRHLLEKDRVQTLMFWRKKGENKLSLDHELRSNLDVFPTICEMVGYTPKKVLDGRSLSAKGHEYILMEDHKNFNLELGQTIEYWAVIWKNHIYWLDVIGWDMYDDPKGSDFDHEYFEKLIGEKMTDYLQNKRAYGIMHRYEKGDWKERTMFSDGTLLSDIKNENG